LEVSDIGLEDATLPHFVGEKVVIILLSLPVRGVLNEKCFDYLLEIVERVGATESRANLGLRLSS